MRRIRQIQTLVRFEVLGIRDYPTSTSLRKLANVVGLPVHDENAEITYVNFRNEVLARSSMRRQARLGAGSLRGSA
jgi:hypothetical protein